MGDAKSGRPMGGDPERLLRGIFRSVGLDLDQAVIVSAISCASAIGFDQNAQGKLTAEGERQQRAAAECCRAHVEWVIDQFKPQVVLALGGLAIRSLTDDWTAGVDKTRGTTHDYRGALMVGAEHPKSTLKGLGFSADVLAMDCAKVARWLAGGFEPWREELHIAPKPALLRELAARWRASGKVAVDVETIPVPKNRWLCPLRAIGLGDEVVACSVPYFADEVDHYYTPAEWLEVRLIVRELLLDRALTKVFHHRQFDEPVLHRYGFRVRGSVRDTMVGHHVLHQRGVRHTLQYAAAQYLDVPAWKSAFEKEWEEPFPELGAYNARDCLSTARLDTAELAELGRRGLLATYDLELWNAEIAWQQSRRGLWVDEHERELERVEARTKARALEAAVYDLSGVDELHRGILARWADARLERWADVKIDDLVGGGASWPPIGELEAWLAAVAEASFETRDKTQLRASFEKLGEVRAEIGEVTRQRSLRLEAIKAKPKPRFPCKLEAVEAWLAWDDETRVAREEAAADRKLVSKLCAVVRSAISRLDDAVHRAPFVNVSASGQMGRLLFEHLGLESAELPNAKGEWPVNEHALHHLKEQPVVKTWKEWQTEDFYARWLEELPVFPDGRIHHAYKSHTTPSARYAAGSDKDDKRKKSEDDRFEKWNAQNVNKRVMRVLAAPPGRVLIAGDVKGAELRVLCACSGDPTMYRQILDYEEGRCEYNMHELRAMGLWADYLERDEKEQKVLYTIGKRANFLIVYGGGPGVLRDVWKEMLPAEPTLDEQKSKDDALFEECRKVIAAVKADWHVAVRWLEAGYDHALRQGELVIGHFTGATIRFPIRTEDKVDQRACFNYPIQRSARELVVDMSRRINRRLPSGCFQVADNHDQLIFEVPRRKVQAVKAIMTEEMNFTWRGVPIATDILVGQTWLDVK